MRALRSAPSGLVFFRLTLTYIDVSDTEVMPQDNFCIAVDSYAKMVLAMLLVGLCQPPG